MTEELSAKRLEKIAETIDEVTFINTSKGRVVVFNPDQFCWNAYGKENFQSEDNPITDEQWNEFMSENTKYFFLELDDDHQNVFNDYCEEHKIGDYK